MSKITLDTILIEWKSPNTYSNNFSPPTSKSGVYAIAMFKPTFNQNKRLKKEIVYIGCSVNLLVRLKSHEVIKVLRAMFDGFYISVHFKECDNYKSLEKQLIGKFQPRINQQHG